MKKIAKLKYICLVSALGLGISQSYAGIPVIDEAAIKQDVMNHVKQIAEMGKQLLEAQKQLEQMKKQYEAIYGIKGFTDILQNAGIDPNMISNFENIINDNVEKILEGSTQLDFSKKMQDEIDRKIAKITELSQRAQNAKDAKSIAELQANIQMQQASLSTLQLQADNFEKAKLAQEKIELEKTREQYRQNNERRAALIQEAARNTGKPIDSVPSSFSDILKSSNVKR